MRCQGARCQGTGTWHQQTRGKEVPCTCPLAPDGYQKYELYKNIFRLFVEKKS